MRPVATRVFDPAGAFMGVALQEEPTAFGAFAASCVWTELPLSPDV
ncbi:hypothetical protein HRW23_29610 [Streptomyces lunaelactis]|nr:hypothetical protein [Streptomyces lunaelactis]NUK02398.1 hypothetical protein [Streptomyces lunaelactis]NUK09281.1 hypothetical protein [Streptomyces lunaelactis]NUK16405.1 hypothetical protein [Streptomyces lunaelactis]NUK23193.1 hypothetical protein [Streptomyces lunaelactis]NUK34589.1 hypothetical protein [Streptomyces lunaelactis]